MFEELFAGRSPCRPFRCEPAEPVWHGLEASDAGALITFPLTSVVVEPDGGEAVLANANHAMFFNRGGATSAALTIRAATSASGSLWRRACSSG